MSAMICSCFNKQTSSETSEDAAANMKIVPLPLVPTSAWENQNLSEFLVLLVNINESSQHDVVNSFMDSLEFIGDNLNKRPTITVFEAPVKKSVSFDLNSNIEYHEDTEYSQELTEYRKKVDMNMYYYFRRLERDDRRERIKRIKRALAYPWRALSGVFRRRRRSTIMKDNI